MMETVPETQPPKKNKKVSFLGISLSLVVVSCVCGFIIDSTHESPVSLTMVNTFMDQVTDLTASLTYSDTDKMLTNTETVLAGYEEWSVLHPQKAYASDNPLTLGDLYSDILPDEQITTEIEETKLSYTIENGHYQVCAKVPDKDYAMTYLTDGTFQSTPTCE